MLAVFQKNISKGLKCYISASILEGYIKNVTTMLRVREAAREQHRVIIGKMIQNNDAMRQIIRKIFVIQVN